MGRLEQVLKTHAFDKILQGKYAIYERTIANYLAEPFAADLALEFDGEDITTNAIFSSHKTINASLEIKREGILAGIEELEFFLGKTWTLSNRKKIDPTSVKLMHISDDGAKVTKGMTVAILTGPIQDILKLDRTILNFLQHMCGVATLAHQYVEACSGFDVLVCPTRKTPWGLLDKKACLVGGAGTHRLDLNDAVLVKDTHLDLLNHDFDELGKKLLSAEKLGRFVEVEVESADEAWKAAEMLDKVRQQKKVPCYVMLDNMKPQEIASFMKEFKNSDLYDHIFFEASGGITLQNIQEFAKTGVDILSVGAITHSAPALDISLKIRG